MGVAEEEATGTHHIENDTRSGAVNGVADAKRGFRINDYSRLSLVAQFLSGNPRRIIYQTEWDRIGIR